MPRDFSTLPPDPSWSYADCTARETGYITHCYHRYPAKFIPQVAARLIREHSEPGAVVLDPFMGSGTTLVEALVAGRRARGCDLNPAALIAARAKTTPIAPHRLHTALRRFRERLAWLAEERRGPTLFPPPRPLLPAHEAHATRESAMSTMWHGTERWQTYPSPAQRRAMQERLDWWFPRDQQRTLGTLLAIVEAEEDPAIRAFLRCAFSHTLKAASYWLMKSSKPTRDRAKLSNGVPDPVPPLLRQLRKMQRANLIFWHTVPEAIRRRPERACDVRLADSRRLPWNDRSVGLVVTSPPYVTSYEYADLHELTTLWLGDLILGGVSTAPHGSRDRGTPPTVPGVTKAGFIGSAAARTRERAEANSPLARQIVAALRLRSLAKAEEVRQYFLDMQTAFRQMRRVLKPGGKVCDVIGNTALHGVPILNAEVHAQLLEHLGFTLLHVVKRLIPLKTLPQGRDPASGKFTSDKTGAVHAYPEEFILIARK